MDLPEDSGSGLLAEARAGDNAPALSVTELSMSLKRTIEASYGRVRVRLSRGHAEEDLWLTVVRSRRSKYGVESFIAELQADSALWPHLKAGERVKLSYYQAVELELALPSAQ